MSDNVCFGVQIFVLRLEYAVLHRPMRVHVLHENIVVLCALSLLTKDTVCVLVHIA